MEFMNDFIEKHDGSMKEFLDQISVSHQSSLMLMISKLQY